MQNKKTLKRIAGWTAVGVFWLIIWQLAYYGVGRDLLLASPLAVFERIGELVMTGEFWLIIGTSFYRIMSGFVMGLLVGAALGLITAKWRPVYQLIQLPMNIIKATPVASFVILALIWISGKNLSVFIAFLMVLPLVWSSVDQGL